MERVIQNLELVNMSTGEALAALYPLASNGRIVAADNFGTQDITVHWQLDARGESREYKDSAIKPATYKITVLSDVYDGESKIGDKMRVQMTRYMIDVGRVYNYAFGILQTIERDRFERNNTTRYSTAYTVYVDNPLWWLDVGAFPVAREEYNMALVASRKITLSGAAVTEKYTLTAQQTNVTRGVKLVLMPDMSYSYTYPLDINITINGYAFSVTLTGAPTEDIVFVFGESAVYCNCERAESKTIRSNVLDAYGDFSAVHIKPIQWAGDTYDVTLQIADGQAGAVTVGLYMIQGEYF